MTSQRGPQRARNSVVAALFVAVVALTIVPTGLGLSSGITTETTPALDPEHGGCTACHGGGAFATQSAAVTVVFTDEAGEPLAGPYEHGATYTVTITLDEQNAPEAANRAGFNFFIDAGTLEAGDNSQVSGSGQEATHVNAGTAVWTVLWTAPEEGAATWRAFVNDVDGSGAPDAPDQVYLLGGWVTDDNYAMPGAVEEHEPHVGVPLPQYWLGLIALATMMVVIIFAYVYLKYSNPHNADQKDR